MRVRLVAHTPEPEKVVAEAAQSCHSDRYPELTPEQVEGILGFVLKKRHHSVLEHASFTFAVEGLSRTCSHQLVRHRMASYSQQSQRHVRARAYVTPPSIARSGQILKRYKEAMAENWQTYESLIGEGIPLEDARYVLPNATQTAIVITMNARELFHFFELRLCLKSQWEIRRLAGAMLREVKKAAPLLFEGAGPPCKRGICPEGDVKCKLYPH
jgi:thymidylate synthase (FAD)